MSNARAVRPNPSGRSRCGLGLGLWLWGVAAALSLGDAAVRADETVMIHVRGRTQLRLSEGERKTADGDRFQFVVRVQLDDGQESVATGAPAGSDPSDPTAGPASDPAHSFASQRVQLHLSGPDGALPAHSVLTGSDGRAVWQLSDLPTGSYTVVANYEGDDLRDSARADLTVDLGRLPVTLTLIVPPQAASTEELPIELRLQSEGLNLKGAVQLSLGELRYLVPMSSGFARKVVPLRAQAWLRKGHPLAVIASYPGDRFHTSALQRRDVLITTQARVTLELPVTELAQGSPLTAQGVVSDEEGPLADQPIDLEASEQPGGERLDPTAPSPLRSGRAFASGVSDQQGRFRIVIPRLPLRPGPAVLAAQVTPRRHSILPARSAELPFTVLPPEPVSALYYILPLLATALGGLLWLFGRWLLPAWRRWLVNWRARLRRPAQATASALASTSAAASQELATGEPGVSLSQGRRLPALTLRRTIDQTIDGQVVDASFGRPVAGAVLTLQLSGSPIASGSAAALWRTIDATDDGRFAIEQLAVGRYLIEVQAPGYLPQRFTATVPHRGELRGVSVRLEPIRVRLLGEWRRVAQRLLGQEAQLRTATPRELLEQFGRLRGVTPIAYGANARELRHLTELVEQAYYSRRVCTPEMLAEAARLADALLKSDAPASVALAGAPRPTPGPPVPLS